MDDYSDYEDEDFEPDVDSGQTSQKPSAYYKATPGSNRVAKKKPKSNYNYTIAHKQSYM